jgi:hypothetical protein
LTWLERVDRAQSTSQRDETLCPLDRRSRMRPSDQAIYRSASHGKFKPECTSRHPVPKKTTANLARNVYPSYTDGFWCHVCPACGKAFSVADEIYERKVQGRVVTIKCKQCQAGIRVDATNRNDVEELAGGERRCDDRRSQVARDEIGRAVAQHMARVRQPHADWSDFAGCGLRPLRLRPLRLRPLRLRRLRLRRLRLRRLRLSAGCGSACAAAH